jgi:hypothetical protein
MKNLLLPVAATLIVAASGLSAARQVPPGIRQERVTFAKGTSSATITAQIKGDATVDYLVRAGAGQTLAVTMKASNLANYFNVLPPGSADVAMYIGQTSGETYSGTLPADGDYAIRVYLMRSAARRNESSNYTLTVRVTGKALAPLPASQDAVLPGTSYHASAPVTCVPSPYGEAKPQTCEAFVVRRGRDGTATVEIKQAGRVSRRILFVQGKPVASDSFEKMTASRQGDVTTVTFESGERYEIFDALIFGG